MIVGTVNARREATLSLTLRGPSGGAVTVQAVIDTGYSGFLTAPPAVVAQLGLTRTFIGEARLADGTLRSFDVFRTELDWDGTPRDVPVSVLGDETLVGMKLLAECRLTIDVTPGGAVEITPL